MMITLVIFLAAMAAAAAALLMRDRQYVAELQGEITKLRAGHRSVDHFLSAIFREMRSESGISGAMHAAAGYLAEQSGAEAAAIYEMNEGQLVIAGLHGPFPLIHSGNRIILSNHAHLFELLRRERIRSGTGFIGGMVDHTRAELVPNASLDSRFDEYPDSNVCGSAMAMPLYTQGQVIGVACVFGNRQQPLAPFSEEQLASFQMLAPQMVMTLELDHAYGEISRRQRIDQELEFARQIQFSMLPDAFPSWDQFLVTAFTRSAKEVNGDFYDFVEIDDDRLLIVIGDACGKGVPACMLTAMTRSVIRAMTDNFTTLNEFLMDLNAKMHRGTDADRFITIGCCLLDRKNSLMEFGRAGHTELLTFVRNHIRSISPQGVALGILPQELAQFDTFCMAFEPGMSLMLFSDGITEAINAKEEEFGIERLKELFSIGCRNGESARSVINLILEEVGHFEYEQSDDQTMVIIQLK